jgi:Holliday junction resolvasome RuvABC endonuclease subunit
MISVSPIDNTVIFQKIKHLVRKLKPERIVIEDYTGKNSNKSKRVIELLKRIKSFAKRKGIVLSAYSREQIKLVFRNWFAETRYEIAEVISKNVEAFSNLMFDKPKYPKTEHFRSAQFDAASLGITHYYFSQ